MAKRKPRSDYVCGEPAVFHPIVASPEAQAEFDELEKYKLTPDEPFDYQILRLRKSQKEAEERGWGSTFTTAKPPKEDVIGQRCGDWHFRMSRCR